MSSKTVWGLGLLLLTAGAGVGLYKQLPAMPQALEARVADALKAEGLGDIAYEVDGLNVRLSFKTQDFRPGVTAEERKARLMQAAAAVRSLQPELPPEIEVYVPKGEGYLYGPALQVLTDTSETPMRVSMGKTDHALSDL
ncbi:hypothetical protein [Asticcacaulis sp.]|jgi:hypothetical protein|uniref:hypothetical protein n=1 Tax=Asticcacaulis sp. TaxID=1872648 RepID=UPI00262E53E3|nr:hypothetical protein [Asticcacaulis sp.]